MAYIHIATSRGFTVDDVRMIDEKVGDRSAIDGLLVESYGQDGDVVRVVTIWESKAHKDRYEAELLLPRSRPPASPPPWARTPSSPSARPPASTSAEPCGAGPRRARLGPGARPTGKRPVRRRRRCR